MDEPFLIEIIYEGKEYGFETRLSSIGYAPKFYVIINGLEVIYEPDEERNYRAILNEKDHGSIKDIDKELIKAVGEKIELIRGDEDKTKDIPE